MRCSQLRKPLKSGSSASYTKERQWRKRSPARVETELDLCVVGTGCRDGVPSGGHGGGALALHPNGRPWLCPWTSG
eukprot:scaffold14528_cov68-Phaeocystis_antarctica.AAC.3